MNRRFILAGFAALLFGGVACSSRPAGREAAGAKAGGDKLPVLAEVDGVPVTGADLDFEWRLRRWGKKSPKDDKDRSNLLEELIDRLLILARGKTLGLKPSSADLDVMIREASQGYSLEAFKASLAEQGILFSDWQSALEQRWIVVKTVETDIVAKISVRPSEVKDYYWEHLSDFRRKERRGLRQILTAARPEADKALQEVLLGLSFAEAARKYSFAPEGAKGGDLGLLSRAELPPSIGNVAFNLKKGRPSGVFKSPYGFHILLVENAEPARLLTLDEAAPQIRRQLLEMRQQKPYQDWLASLRRNARILRYEGHASTTGKAPGKQKDRAKEVKKK